VWRASLALLIASCGSPPPGSVDEETLLVDLEACARGDIVCQKSGNVVATDALLSAKTTVRIGPGGTISLPVLQNEGRRLVYIAMGVRSEGVDRKLAITVSGHPGSVTVPTWGWARVEVSQGEFVPSPDARLTLVAEGGTFDVLWVVGRWKRE
jgi:hypothetical protein